MRQFYRMQVTEQERKITFVQPVRKLSISASFDTTIKLHFSDGSVSEAHTLYARNPLYLDFQSANNGGGRVGNLCNRGNNIWRLCVSIDYRIRHRRKHRLV